jgi:hypothetical protein
MFQGSSCGVFCPSPNSSPRTTPFSNRGICFGNNVFKIDQISAVTKSHHAEMKRKELTREQALASPCPTCGARIGQRCELNTGLPRANPHRDRLFRAVEELETEKDFFSSLRGLPLGLRG